MRPYWLQVVRLDLALIGLLAVAACVTCLALALSGQQAVAGVLVIVCAIEACLYWLWRTRERPLTAKDARGLHRTVQAKNAHLGALERERLLREFTRGK